MKSTDSDKLVQPENALLCMVAFVATCTSIFVSPAFGIVAGAGVIAYDYAAKRMRPKAKELVRLAGALLLTYAVFSFFEGWAAFKAGFIEGLQRYS